MAKRKNDIILAVLVLALAAVLWFVIGASQSKGAYVAVTVDGEVFGEFPLNKDAQIRVGNEDAYNLLVIKDGEAQIDEASCPDKLCVNQGKISFDGQSIICLPNKVVVAVRGGEKSGYDAVAK